MVNGRNPHPQPLPPLAAQSSARKGKGLKQKGRSSERPTFLTPVQTCRDEFGVGPGERADGEDLSSFRMELLAEDAGGFRSVDDPIKQLKDRV